MQLNKDIAYMPVEFKKTQGRKLFYERIANGNHNDR